VLGKKFAGRAGRPFPAKQKEQKMDTKESMANGWPPESEFDSESESFWKARQLFGSIALHRTRIDAKSFRYCISRPFDAAANVVAA
jgi:hypothetical protein